MSGTVCDCLSFDPCVVPLSFCFSSLTKAEAEAEAEAEWVGHVLYSPSTRHLHHRAGPVGQVGGHGHGGCAQSHALSGAESVAAETARDRPPHRRC